MSSHPFVLTCLEASREIISGYIFNNNLEQLLFHCMIVISTSHRSKIIKNITVSVRLLILVLSVI